MSVTRANVEAILVKRLGPWLTAAGLATTTAGSNADLNDPIAQALLQAGYTVASITSVADADLSGVAAADVPKVLDLAELRTLETIYQAWTAVDVTGLGYAQKDDQFGARIQAAITRKLAQIASRYGVGRGSLAAGVIALDYQETD